MIGAYPKNAITSPMIKQAIQSSSLSVTAHRITDIINNAVPTMQKRRLILPPLLLPDPL